MNLGRTPDHPVVIRCAGLLPIVHYKLAALLPYLGCEKVWVKCDGHTTPFWMDLSAPLFAERHSDAPPFSRLTVVYRHIASALVFEIPVPQEYWSDKPRQRWKAYYYLKQCLWPHSHLRDCACAPWKDYQTPIAAQIAEWSEKVA